MATIVDELRSRIEAEPLASADDIETFRVRYLGRKNGLVTHLFKRITEVTNDERRTFGREVNALKSLAEDRIARAEQALEAASGQVAPELDLTLPGRRPVPSGSIHPLTRTLEDIVATFERMGFTSVEGPEIEDDWYNFTALNFPPDHPARDMQDTFFVEAPSEAHGGILLRTHTSPVQVRVMQSQPPPIRVVIPGRVYRNESISYKSFCLFHQVEGLYVDEGVSMADLKYVLSAFARALFGSDVRMRFRPSFFPFTEPSMELDIWWQVPGSANGGRWMEILGSGMVDPNVFTACGIDPERFTGYAFGMGVERIAMIRYGIEDIRTLYENDSRFLEQF